MWTALKIAGGAGVAYAAVAAWVFLTQRGLVYCPRRELIATPDQAGLSFKDVWLSTGPGTRIHGWWLPCEGANRVLLLCHGNGGNISHLMETYRIFHDLGLSVLSFDYSGYGRSGGRPSEKATRHDARAAWDWLVRDKGFEPGRVILFGRSLGGGVAARLAADLGEAGTEPGGLIMESTFTSMTDMGAARYPWLPVRWLVRHRYDSVRALDAVRVPALFLHSPEDDLVPYAMGRALYAGYAGPKLFWALSGDHNCGFMSTSGYTEGLRRFLRGLPGRCG
ncbi:Alpha/beta hydrolase family protein [Pseudodesulfovibrio hydrargyri]|uniref:Alpha/beta hydrolase family protein n=1 Tax=Pseudodesulfovibrio hydrargyri TaxID=2125990 RepID=A0A1J5MVD5_9BACT|nr:alpha/beta hydrolase [Pseudodesulfovibrio hydrargyri]OIQ49772.1 Alpha/beta hydrolase family protein [Pseudodesulfovibrio hydrargyri]